MTTTFGNIRCQGHGSMGTLLIDGSEMKWTPRGVNQQARRIERDGIGKATWSMFGKRLGSLCIFDREGETKLRCDGFAKRDREKLATAMEELGAKFEDREYSSAGVSGGRVEFEDSRLVLRLMPEFVGEKPTEDGEDLSERIFDVDLRDVSHSAEIKFKFLYSAT